MTIMVYGSDKNVLFDSRDYASCRDFDIDDTVEKYVKITYIDGSRGTSNVKMAIRIPIGHVSHIVTSEDV